MDLQVRKHKKTTPERASDSVPMSSMHQLITAGLQA